MTSIVENTTYLSQYCIFSNKAAEDPKLSWAAKGLLVYLISRGPKWEIHVWQLAKVYQGKAKGNSRDAVKNLLKELRDAGYVRYEKFRNKQGQWNHRYKVYPEPIEEFKKKFPQTDDPALDNPAPVDPSIRTIPELAIPDLNPPPLSPPPKSEPPKESKPKKAAAREVDDLDLPKKKELLSGLDLTDLQRKRLLVYQLTDLQRAITISKGITPKKGLMNLLVHILKHPEKYDPPEEKLTDQQRLALKHNEELRHNYPDLAKENDELIRTKHEMAGLWEPYRRMCDKFILEKVGLTTISLKDPLPVVRVNLEASRAVLEEIRKHKLGDKSQ